MHSLFNPASHGMAFVSADKAFRACARGPLDASGLLTITVPGLKLSDVICWGLNTAGVKPTGGMAVFETSADYVASTITIGWGAVEDAGVDVWWWVIAQ